MYYFSLHPERNISEIIHFWKCSTVTLLCVFTEQEKWPGTWWKHLVVAGIASAVAGTFMAPSDSLKDAGSVHASCTL
jgi:hypothetical protein